MLPTVIKTTELHLNPSHLYEKRVVFGNIISHHHHGLPIKNSGGRRCS